MALLLPDRRWRGLIGALAIAAFVLVREPASAAGSAPDLEFTTARGFSVDTAGVMTLNGPEVRQGTTLLRAVTGTATGLDADKGKNSTWKFSGDVHLEFDGAVLNAQAATAVFMNGQLGSVVVQASAAQQPKKPVRVEFNGAMLDVDSATVTFVDGRINTIQALGAPAQFSHLLKKNGRRVNGRSNRLDYDAGKSLIRLSVDTWFSSGNKDFETQEVTYNLADGSYSSPGTASGTYRPEERVPAPRTPDRSTAK